MEMLEEDRQALCGPPRCWQKERTAYRHGYGEGQLVLGGRKVKLPKPRVRSVEGREVELPSWEHFAEEDPLRRRVLEQILVGVSSRKYARSLEPVPEELGSAVTSRSSVSRRFVARSQAKVEEFLSRPLADLDLPVIMLDGTGLGDHVLVVALGIDVTGKKHVLGLVEGSTESEGVCRTLLSGLIERGLNAERARLFVIDGGKGIRRAIRDVFGVWALVQRCQVHKLRNSTDHLPQGKRTWVRAVVRRAWGSNTVEKASGKLRELASQLEADHPGAAGSVREGLDETLTVIELGLTGWLMRTLSSTNAIENLQGSVKRVARNVKRWRGGSMAERWAATALIEAEKQFRRIKGHREMSQLLRALETWIQASTLDKKVKVA
jgi:transposase-like protein